MYNLSEKIMGMNSNTWERHANPWSVYSRFTALPLLCLSIWSREWLGMTALFPVILTIVWIWLNPRLFKAPKTLDSWAAKGVLGERLFLQRKSSPIPSHHVRAAHRLTALSFLGVCLMGYGLWQLDFWATLCGVITSMGAKTWFFDRMVWLYEDVKQHPQSDPESL
ncbi:MAG: hypothetical protein HWE34_07915 [Methylocystaceae bacterium]|nr:hypothetical protein [Methylocystaceae bacterium]